MPFQIGLFSLIFPDLKIGFWKSLIYPLMLITLLYATWHISHFVYGLSKNERQWSVSASYIRFTPERKRLVSIGVSILLLHKYRAPLRRTLELSLQTYSILLQLNWPTLTWGWDPEEEEGPWRGCWCERFAILRETIGQALGVHQAQVHF